MTGECRAFLMVWDGLRPDMITEQFTPNLSRLAAEGVRFSDSHAVFPTVTRANSASIATGALPATHGIPGNTFYAPALDPARVLATSDAAHLGRLAAYRGGRLLTCDTLADRLAGAGGRTVVVSTGSTGSALLQHPTCEPRQGLLLNPGLWLGTSRERIEARIGPMPPGSLPNSEQNAWFTRAITDVLLPEEQPRLLSFWHTDPDRTQHDRGIGHPETLRALRDADDNLGAILAALDRLDLRGSTDLLITSDHGFSTIIGHVDVAAELVREGLKQSAASADVVVTGGAVYVQDHDAGRVARIITYLQQREGIGSVFRRVSGGRPDGTGALPLDSVGVDGELAPEILFSHDWRDEANEHGAPGGAWSTPTSNAATHGSISPWDIRNSLVAAGPSFKRGAVSDLPAGNIDIAPTLAQTLGLPPFEGGDGRVLVEALLDGPAPGDMHVERTTLVAESEHVRFRQTLHLATVGRTRYVDFGRVER
jgi:predicted AlkP superfamily pyrophosphatase or phosphodiesterase